MSRRAANLDLSIRYDELEQQRVQLENNLQHTDLSLHLSSSPGDYSDVEYPRHNSVHSPPYSAFASFDHRSGDDFDPHEQSRFQAWSYHTADAEEGVHTYAAETLSTAAHHASALTISAGLGGGARGGRRDISLSGAEYDPDRPLQGIVAGIAGRLKGFDANSTKSRQITTSVVDYDPLIVDDTAELDRVLQSGHAPPATLRSARSSTSSSSSSDTTEPLSPQPQFESRPRLSDALSHIAFSPKRPRSAQALPSPRIASLNMPTRSPTPDRSSLSRHLPRSSSPNALQASTPRFQRRTNQSLSYAQPSFSQSPPQPEVNVHPATPSVRERDQSSKFTNLARGIAREIEEEADAVWRDNTRQEATPRGYHHSTVATKPKGQREPLREMWNEKPDKSLHPGTPFKQRVHLPDVTGLTSAIASPARVDVEFYGYDPKETTEHEARLIATLTVVQNKLTHLEAENSVSRRRVRELELELEACKKEVARERTRILEQSAMREDTSSAGTRDRRSQQRQQQQQKAREEEAELASAEARYKAAVEEKKALEALITTLRTHLSRLTAELSDHKQLLLELRTLRDSDARTLAEKSKEVDRLRQEVERLAGEVEVLRGVVEEGLKERRNLREQSVSQEQESRTGSEDLSNEEEHSTVETSSQPAQQQPQPQQRIVVHEPSVGENESSDEESVASSSRRSPTPSPKRRPGAADRTMRTDHATLASSQIPSLSTSKPFLDTEEMSRITQEIEERRSERSASMHSGSSDQSQSRSHSRERSRNWSLDQGRASRPPSPSIAYDHDQSDARPDAQPEPAGRRRAYESSRPASPRVDAPQGQPRPAAPTPAAALRDGKRRTQTEPAAEPEAPFPQIRGTRLERLFFSAPEHNAETCTVCHRRRRRQPEMERATTWLNDRARARADEEDEGYAEGPDDYAHERRESRAQAARGGGEDDRVPPQTVLARVLRELEDDFTHYKSIYVELADQYKDMDPVSNVVKRNVLADHLREVIDILEQKGNQIASLYDLLTFKDKPVSESAVPKAHPAKRVPTTGPAQARAQPRRYPSS
ncbi:hypothetical protein PYCCODRAFT_1410888 [Trametes coccinea BRFM310]|uniref:Cep57 centrosome microtubule-binding domain-containing protein n=1 Tax=Trametes coccinea (strain BRFM310) TaxID=1353009 RepID=A0A1Y2IQB7_TRAC3|nr:hypothetical protein PYCCODRAFT_1410888 [Trametes coccinea BRFM310]